MIDTQAIRSKILDLAMRGKLTEQLPEDGTAEELYQQIQAEKQKLIKAGKIQKEKPLPDITADEIPFEIPLNWKWVRLGSIGITATGGTPTKSHPEYYGGDYPFFKPSDLDAGPHIINASEYLTETGKEASRQFPQNSILVCCIGSIGKAAIIDSDGTANQQINVLTPFDCNSDYLLYAIGCREFQHQLDQGSRATTVSIINKSKFDSCILSLPPLAEQHRIVKRIEQVFSVLDTIYTLQAKYADNLAVLKSKLIDAAIQGKLTEQLPEDGTAEELYQQIQAEKQSLIKAGKIKKEKPLSEISDDKVPFEIPNNWKWVRWGDVVNVVSARRVHQADWRESGVPFYRAREIAKLAEEGFVNNELFISEELYADFSLSGVPHENDLMVSAVGTLGRTYVVKAEDRFYYKDASVLCFENFGHINPYFLAYAMKSNMMRQQIESNSGGTTVDTLTMVRMIKYFLPLPTIAEQKRIVAKLEKLFQATGAAAPEPPLPPQATLKQPKAAAPEPPPPLRATLKQPEAAVPEPPPPLQATAKQPKAAPDPPTSLRDIPEQPTQGVRGAQPPVVCKETMP